MNAILVIKDIKNCDDYYAEVNIKNKKNHKKIKTFAHIDLKPMPQELPTPYMMRQIQIANGIQTEKPPYTEDYQKGYNDCVDEILGEEK